MRDRQAPLWPWHAARLARAGLQLPAPAVWAAALPLGDLRVRLHVRPDGWSVEHEPLGPRWDALHLHEGPAHVNPAPQVKWADRAAYSALYAARPPGTDDVLLFTPSGHISETTRLNLAWYRGGRLHLPDHTCAPLQGVMRTILLETGPWPMETGAYGLDHLLQADWVIATNAVRGLVWVRQIGGRTWEAFPEPHRTIRDRYEEALFG